jgi:hypothetical protein
MGEINQEIAALRQEVAQLRRQIDATDDWACSLFSVLHTVLPFLLRGHPQVEKVRDLLQAQAQSFEELSAHPEREGDLYGKASMQEAGKMLYYQLAMLDVWPGVDSKAVIRQTLERAGRKEPPAD